MTDHEPVDFVVGPEAGSRDAQDEELTQPPRRSPRLVWGLGAVAVIAVAVVAIINRHDTPPTSAAAPSPRASVATPTPDVVSVTAQIRVPEGNRSTRALPDCPPGAECYSDTAVPTPTIAALRREFPGAQLTSATSVLADRLGRFGPDLVSRLLHVRAGSVDITVTARKPGRSDTNGYTHDRTGQLLHSLDTYAGSAFTVSVEIVQLGPKHRPSRAALDRIARDPRLVVPQ